MEAFEAFLNLFPERTGRERADARQYHVRALAIAQEGPAESTPFVTSRMRSHVKKKVGERRQDAIDERIYRRVDNARKGGARVQRWDESWDQRADGPNAFKLVADAEGITPREVERAVQRARRNRKTRA